MSFSLIEKIAEKFTLCKRCSMICCVNYGDIEESHSKSTEPSTKSNSNSTLDPDAFFAFDDMEFKLSTYSITTDSYVNEDIGKFITDLDGYCMYINSKGAEHLGANKTKIMYSILWMHNLHNDEFKYISDIWNQSLNDETGLFHTQCHYINNHKVYLVIEAYPIFSGTRFKGLRGIIMRVTKPLWTKLNARLHTSNLPPHRQTEVYHGKPQLVPPKSKNRSRTPTPLRK